MSRLHNLLKRQMRKHFGINVDNPDSLNEFLLMVNHAYWEFDSDRNMLERALDLSSQELLEANMEMRAMLQALPDVLVRLDKDGLILDYKAGISTDIYMGADQIIGKNLQEVCSGDFEKALKETISHVQSSGSIVDMEYSFRRGDHDIFYEFRFVPLFKDQSIAIIRNITKRKQLEEQLRFLSMHDALTGLFNRAYFKEQFMLLDQEPQRDVSLILCDIDGLKLINDTMGHDAGDRLLIATADLLSECLGRKHIICRIGGDEFAIVTDIIERSKIEKICESIRSAINQHNQVNYGLPLSISLGFAIRNNDSQQMEDIFKEADDSMYREKLHHQQSVRSNMVQTLMEALGERDFITQGHANRLQELVNMLGLAIGLQKTTIDDMNLLAHFHDIGKVGISDGILFKKGPLDPREKTEMERHSEIGFRIAQSSPDLLPISTWILHHHEAWDGSGYPLGLKENDIPQECRILALADAYDAMTNDRPYRKAMSHEQAVQELQRCAGSQFDPELTELFIKLLEA